jgi:hypothetical protein
MNSEYTSYVLLNDTNMLKTNAKSDFNKSIRYVIFLLTVLLFIIIAQYAYSFSIRRINSSSQSGYNDSGYTQSGYNQSGYNQSGW